jgi:hypothetical protein
MAEKVIGFKIQIEGLAGTIETATQLKRQIAELNSELKKTADVDEIKKLEKKLVDLKAAQSLVNDVTREQVKLRKEEIAGIDKSQGAYRKLSKELNDQRNRYKDLAAAEQESSQEARDLLVSINALDKRLKGIDATVGQFQRNVGGYTEALGQFFPKLGGTIGNVTGLIGDLSSGFAQLGKTTGVANIGLGGIGLALTAFSGISAIIDEVSQSARAIFDLKLQLENFGVAAENLDEVAVRAQTIGEIFKVSADEVAVAANVLVKEFGVPFEKAFDTIQSGFLKGADAQGEFIRELKEYPAQFKLAGIGIEEFLAISIDSANKGVFSDKALDAVKEFGIQVRDQTKSAKDALIGAFGEEFTTNLFQNIKNGSITSGEALQLVTKEIKETGVNSVDLQRLISTLFVGAGEDAGAYVLTLGDVLNNTDNLFGAETELQKQLERNIKVTQDLNEETAKYSQTVIDAEISRKEFLNGLKSIALFIGDTFIGIINAVAVSFSELFGINDEFVKRIKAQNDRASQEDYERLVAQGVLKKSETKKQGEEILKVGSEAWKKRENQLMIQRESDLNKEKEKAKLLKESLLQTEDGLQKELDAKKKKRKSIAFGTEEFKKVESEIKQLEKELEKFNPKESGKKGGEKFVKEFTVGSIAALENKRSELQSAFSNAVVGSDSQKEIAVKLNEVNAQIKTAVDTQNEILGLNAEKKKADAIEEINQNFKVAQSVINLARAKETTSEDEIENINQRRIVLDNDYAREVQRINNLLALEKTGSKEAENLLIERRAAEANYIKGKEGLEKQEKAINDSRLAAEKKFSQMIKQLEIDAIKDETQRNIAAAKQKLADDLENLEKDKDFILLSELEKAKLRKLLIGKTEDEIAALIEQKEQAEQENRFSKTQKRIELAGQAALALTDLFSTIQSAKFKKDADILNEEIRKTEESIATLEAKAEKASGLKKKRLEKEIIQEKALLEEKNKAAEALQLKAAKDEKKIAIIQSIIQGALAVQRALSFPPGPPVTIGSAIATGVLSAIQTATIIAQPLAEGGVVTGQRVNQKQNIPTRSNGDNVLAYVKRGEVVLNQRQQSLLGGSPTFRRIGIKGFAEGGLVPPISAPIQALSGNNDLGNFLQVIEAKTDAINNRIDRLQAYVVSDDIARDLAEGNKLKVKATL